MSGKNILFIISTLLIAVVMESSVYAGHRNKDREECGFSTFVRKCLNCFIPKQTIDDENKESLLERGGFSFTPGILVERDLNNIPVEMLWKICYTLSPLDIMRLSCTSKNLRIKINEDFWKSYIKVHGQKEWDKHTAAITVAWAFSLFEEGKIGNAAKLGLPKAIEIVRKKENEIEAKKWESSLSASKRLPFHSYEYVRAYSPISYGGSFRGF